MVSIPNVAGTLFSVDVLKMTRYGEVGDDLFITYYIKE
jgi:hypothetical protein